MRHGLKALVKDRVGPYVARRQPTRQDLPLDHWGLEIGPTGTLWSEGVDLEALAREHGTPLHLVRGDALARNARAALGSGRTEVFYSYKTNPVPAVLQRLHAHGIGAEVISPFELWLALELGVPPELIVYNGPAKSEASLRMAIEQGVLLVNANSLREAGRIAELARDVGRPAELGIRVSLPGMWGGQFGIPSSSPQLLDAVRAAQADPAVRLRGLHVHRGGTMRHRAAFEGYVEQILAFGDELRAATGWHPDLLDIGGSLACSTVANIPARQFRLNRALGCDLLPPDPADCLSLGEAAEAAAGLVASHAARAGVPAPVVLQEPGRALTSDTQMLLSTVVDVKPEGDVVHAVLDAGVNVAEPVRGEYHQLFSVSAPGAPATDAYRLAGPICTPADVLYNHWRLPRLEPGHVVAIMDTGAYFIPFSTSFSFPRPAVIVQDGGAVSVARAAETFEDLVRNDRAEPRGASWRSTEVP